uniref:Putative secreted peptide n=1 Tax=Anopheles braziliensis TaxID=58242 RepID=A0A2M3ZT81_9DIPT
MKVLLKCLIAFAACSSVSYPMKPKLRNLPSGVYFSCTSVMMPHVLKWLCTFASSNPFGMFFTIIRDISR